MPDPRLLALPALLLTACGSAWQFQLPHDELSHDELTHHAPAYPEKARSNNSQMYAGSFLPTAANCGVISGPRAVYPKAARKAHLEGTVTVEFSITKTGEVSNVRAVSGDPIFVPAALDAAKNYRFAPCRLPVPGAEPFERTIRSQFDFNLRQ